MPDGSYSVSDIQDYIEYILKKDETLKTILPIYLFTSIELVFKIKDGYKIELQTSETIQLFSSTKNQ